MAEPTRSDPLLALQERLAADLRPVEPFRPLRSALGIAAVGVVLGVGVLFYLLGLRQDAGALGPLWLWGPALVSIALGSRLVFLSLRCLVPGNLVAPPTLLGATVAALVATGLLYVGVHRLSPIETPRDHALEIGLSCFGMEILLSLPIFACLLLAARRGLSARPFRPALVGTLGVALIADAVWRLFCMYSDPGHVVTAHGLSMITIVLVGCAGVLIWDRWRLGRVAVS